MLIRTVDYLPPSFPLTSTIPFHVIYVPSQNVHCQLTFPGTVGVNGPYNDSSQTVSHCALWPVRVGDAFFSPVATVRDLGVYIDADVTVRT